MTDKEVIEWLKAISATQKNSLHGKSLEERKAAEYDEAGDVIAADELDVEAYAYRNAIKIVKSGGVADGRSK